MFNSHPDTPKLKVLEMMFDQIRKIAPGIPTATSREDQLQAKAKLVVLGVEEYKLALINPPPT